MEEELSEDIMHFRLVTGEDIIAQVLLEDSEGSTTLAFPMKIVFIPTKEGTLRISLMEWIFSRVSPAQTFDIKHRDILTTSIPSDVMVEYYWEALATLTEKRRSEIEKTSHHKETKEIEEFLDNLEDEVEAAGGDSDYVRNLLNSLSSNTRGTLH